MRIERSMWVWAKQYPATREDCFTRSNPGLPGIRMGALITLVLYQMLQRIGCVSWYDAPVASMTLQSA